jgi:hypothetical protein
LTLQTYRGSISLKWSIDKDGNWPACCKKRGKKKVLIKKKIEEIEGKHLITLFQTTLKPLPLQQKRGF